MEIDVVRRVGSASTTPSVTTSTGTVCTDVVLDTREINVQMVKRMRDLLFQ